MSEARFERNVRFFGKEGQQRLRASSVAVVGVGGLGTHVVQQLALLGTGRLTLIDGEELDVTNFNRYVGVYFADPVPGTLKVDVGERLAQSIDPQIGVIKVAESFISKGGFRALEDVDFVFGCLDTEGARLVLNECCAAYELPYFDLASEIVVGEPLRYGGRVCANMNGDGCLVCLDVLDVQEAARDLADPEERRDRDAIYGVENSVLNAVGPSVISINGVVASLGVTEFMVTATGMRSPHRLLNYHGNWGKVVTSTDEPRANCWYCTALRGQRKEANLGRYIRRQDAKVN